MTRMRWKVAEERRACRNCHDPIPAGEIHIGWICAECTIPHVADSDMQWWIDLYYSELTRAVRVRLGYPADP